MHYGVERFCPTFAGKILQNAFSIWMLIAVSSYTANLAAIFSEDAQEKPLESIDQILTRATGEIHFIATRLVC